MVAFVQLTVIMTLQCAASIESVELHERCLLRWSEQQVSPHYVH